jgi:hypothetical protein
MNQDAWPSPDAPSGPLPRIDELPIVEQGYEQEAVRLAFDSFYRHAAQLDASLRALETVEVFRRDADALRNDLRALRELGLGGLPEAAWPTLRYEAAPRELPTVVLRLAGEAALIVAVAVVAAVGHFRPVVVIALMAAAFVVVAIAEWLGARSRFVSPATSFAPSAGDAAAEAPPALGPPVQVWPASVPSADAGPEPIRQPEALTVVGSADEIRDAAVPLAEAEPAAVADDGQEQDAAAARAEEPAAVAAEQTEERPAVAEADAEEEPVAAEAEEQPVAAEAEEEPAAVADDGRVERDEELEEHDEQEEEAALDPWEQHLADDGTGEDEPELAERAGFFRRRRR